MRFVPVHGAWHYGQLWAPVRVHLEAAGHEVHTPTAGGLGPDDDKHVDLRGTAAPIIDYVRAHELSDIVLVGHSWVGVPYLTRRNRAARTGSATCLLHGVRARTR